MNVDHINPFVLSVAETFSTMVSSKTERGRVTLSDGRPEARAIVATIELKGAANGVVAIHFPINTAMSVVKRLLGTKSSVVDETLLDGVSELLNVIAGGAKARLVADDGPPIDLGLPTVVHGHTLRAQLSKKKTWIDIPFTSDIGNFNLCVRLEPTSSKTAEAKTH